jgi:microcystin degradation protein MlrC
MITAMRRAFPDAVIGVELDPHCHLTPEMLEGADAIVLMKEYPHVDYVERAAELYRICTGAVEGKVRPVQAVFDMHMVGFYPTTSQPMVGLLEQLFAAEREPGILSVSFAHGFPWADVEYVGSRLLVIADGDAELAARTAERLGLAIYRARRELLPQYPDIGQSLQLAAETNGRVVLADTADNPGGGAPGDDTRLLAAILERRLDRVALGPIWDPVAAATAAEAGVGARFLLRIGGKNGVASGTPLDLDIEVCGIAEDFQPAGLGPGARQPMGLSVWVRASGIDLVLCSMRTQGFHPELFTGLGISLEDKRLVVVKSSQHFRAGFDSMADLVIQAATPGTLNMDFSRLPYTRRDGNYFPRVADPLRLDG